MSAELIPMPNVAQVEAKALDVLSRAQALAITDDDTYRAGAEFLKLVKATQAEIDATFDEPILAAHRAHKAALAAKAKHRAPTEQAETVLKGKLRDYEAEQERIRQAEQRRLAEEARQAEETRRLAEAAALEREAMATGDAALLAEAEDIIAEPVMAPVVILPPATPKVAGISYREQWDYEVTNDALIPREFLVRDDKKIAGVVRAMKGATKIPGIRAFSRKVVAAGGGR